MLWDGNDGAVGRFSRLTATVLLALSSKPSTLTAVAVTVLMWV